METGREGIYAAGDHDLSRQAQTDRNGFGGGGRRGEPGRHWIYPAKKVAPAHSSNMAPFGQTDEGASPSPFGRRARPALGGRATTVAAPGSPDISCDLPRTYAATSDGPPVSYILYADDHEDMRLMVRAVLASVGHEVGPADGRGAGGPSRSASPICCFST